MPDDGIGQDDGAMFGFEYMTFVVDIDACFALQAEGDDEAIQLDGGGIRKGRFHTIQYYEVFVYIVYQVWIALEVFNGDGSDSFSFHWIAVCLRMQSSENKLINRCSINSLECPIFPFVFTNPHTHPRPLAIATTFGVTSCIGV